MFRKLVADRDKRLIKEGQLLQFNTNEALMLLVDIVRNLLTWHLDEVTDKK